MLKENKKSNMVSLETLNKISKSVCNIICQDGKNNKWTGTGFFMIIKYENEDLLKCLITNFHVLPKSIIGKKCNIKIQIGDKNKFNLQLRGVKNRIIKYFEKPIDMTLIEILDDHDNDLLRNIEFLSYDLNFIKNGYNYYLNKEIFILQHPFGEKIHSSTGKIVNIKDYEFHHDASTCKGSSGSAIILIENERVIGIHKNKNKLGQNFGTFIGQLFKTMKIDSPLLKRIEKILTEKKIETPKDDNIETPKNDNIQTPKNDNNETPKNDNIQTPKNDNIQTPKDDNIINNTNYLISLSKELNNENYINNDNNLEKTECNNNINNAIILKYIIQRNKNNVILFSKKFLKSNNRQFTMYINNQKYEPCYQLDISKIKIINNILEVHLEILGEIKSLKYMFENTDLFFFSGFLVAKNNDISNMFSHCIYLKTIIGLDLLNTSNIEKMDYLFCKCESLESFPDISKWDTSKVTSMNYIFSGCKKIKKFPDISNWNMSNVIYMKHMFSECESLIELPDISKWILSNAKNLSHLFSNCKSLESLPDIQRWSIATVSNISSMFSGCESLKSIPDISKWETKNIKNMNSLFENCENVKQLNISNWNTKKVENMRKPFGGCKSLRNENTKFWETKRVKNKNKINYFQEEDDDS